MSAWGLWYVYTREGKRSQLISPESLFPRCYRGAGVRDAQVRPESRERRRETGHQLVSVPFCHAFRIPADLQAEHYGAGGNLKLLSKFFTENPELNDRALVVVKVQYSLPG